MQYRVRQVEPLDHYSVAPQERRTVPQVRTQAGVVLWVEVLPDLPFAVVPASVDTKTSPIAARR